MFVNYSARKRGQGNAEAFLTVVMVLLRARLVGLEERGGMKVEGYVWSPDMQCEWHSMIWVVDCAWARTDCLWRPEAEAPTE